MCGLRKNCAHSGPYTCAGDKTSDPGLERMLSISDELHALEHIRVPDAGFHRKFFDSDLALALSARPAGPNHAELRLIAFVLNVHNLARLDLWS